jgi:hypothetical protein
MPQQNSVGRHEIDLTWEDQVNALVNEIILKLYKQYNEDKVKEIENMVKKHLSK